MKLKVTFILLTYNQERYVEAALVSVFEQDYVNLEIVVSDDASTDKTWDTICQVSKRYPDRNTVLNRNESNLGIGGNLTSALRVSSGNILVLGAGDDISRIDRVSRHACEYEANSRLFACYSDFEEMDDSGDILDRGKSEAGKIHSVPNFIMYGGGVGKGATYSYRRECFDWPWPYPKNIWVEDRLLPLRALLLGEVKYIPQQLVRYRLSLTSVSRSIPTHLMLARYNLRHLSELKKTLQYVEQEQSILVTRKELRNSHMQLNLLFIFSKLLGFRPHSDNNFLRVFRYIVLRIHIIICRFFSFLYSKE